MENLQSKTVCVVDNGLFIGLARALVPAFKRVLYTTPTAGPFPTLGEYSVGDGIPGIERLADPNDALRMADDIDLWVFPDLYFAGMQSHLRRLGARVWGSGDAEILELDRLRFKRLAERLHLDVGTYEVVKGLTLAEEFLRRHPGYYLKTCDHRPVARGDFETLRVESWKLARYRLAEIRQRLGHRADSVRLILEKPIPDAIELATDTYTVQGEWPERGVLGLEAKAESYIGKVIDYAKYPECLRDVNEALSPTWKASNYSNMNAIECRITKDGRAWVLDPCLRFGRPPLVIQTLITNWPEILWSGGAGELVQPKFKDTFAAELCIYCDYAETHPTPLQFPEALTESLRLSNYAIHAGEIVCVPQTPGVSGLGSIVATGPTLKAAKEAAREAAKELKGYDVKVSDALDEAESKIEKFPEFGLTW